MPFLPYEDDNNPLAQQQPMLNSGAGGDMTSSGASASNPSNGRKATSSGRWTNLQSYLSANRDQAQAMAGDVSNKITQTAEAGKSQIGSASDAFKSQVMGAKVDTDQTVLDAVKNAPTQLSDEQKSGFMKMRDAYYQGPQYLTNQDGYSEAERNINKAHEMQGLTNSEGGRNALLEETYKRPTYSRGEQKLDQLLVQNNPNARQSFQQVRDQYAGLKDWLGGKQAEADALVNDAMTTTDAARAAARGTVGGEISSLEQSIADRLNSQRQQAQSLSDSLNSDIADDRLRAETLQRLGLNEGQHLYDADLRSYIQQFNPESLSAQSVASSDEHAKYAALAALSGQGNNFLYDAAQAGTANPESFYNKDALLQYLQQKDTAYDNAYKTQRDGILNRQYLINPDSIEGYNGYIPGAYTNRRDLDTATPEELENFWLPLFQNNPSAYSDAAVAGITKSLEDWRRDRWQYNRTVGKE